MGEKYRLQKLNNYISKLKTKGREYLNKEVVNIIGLNKKKHQKSSSLPNIIKEQDILDLVNDKYIINEEETKRIKKNIRNRFNNLIK